jgi:hypothetical protein
MLHEDGVGVHALFDLYVLKQLMVYVEIQQKGFLAPDPSQRIKPYQYFDYIFGAHSGG